MSFWNLNTPNGSELYFSLSIKVEIIILNYICVLLLTTRTALSSVPIFLILFFYFFEVYEDSHLSKSSWGRASLSQTTIKFICLNSTRCACNKLCRGLHYYTTNTYILPFTGVEPERWQRYLSLLLWQKCTLAILSPLRCHKVTHAFPWRQQPYDLTVNTGLIILLYWSNSEDICQITATKNCTLQRIKKLYEREDAKTKLFPWTK